MSTSKVKSRNVRPASTGRVRPMPRNGIPQNEPKKRVGNYLLGNTVGEGTFGKVKIAIHIPTGEKVAVKILEKKRIQDQADVRRVNREIKILKKAKHSNIIQLYEVLDTPNSIYLMMENADGGEMFDYIVANRHVPERQACKFFHQILNGVEELHKNEITHRDLKPENLLLKNSPEGYLIKIVDFGLSNTHDGGRLLSTACGSPCYAAPEMIAGKQYHGPAADTWSLGVILFALVCGHLPFEDPNTSNLYRKILSGEYKTPKWISPEVKDLIRRILETDPVKRLTIEQIRQHQWCQMIPSHSLPHEEPNSDELEETRQEVYKRLEEVGLDVQSVMDAVSSHACNSLSAMYYLLMQKEQLKLRLSKKFSTNSARPETSDRNLLSVAGAKSLDKVGPGQEISHTAGSSNAAAGNAAAGTSHTTTTATTTATNQQSPLMAQLEGEVIIKPIQTSKMAVPIVDPLKKIPPVAPPSKPQIPKLNIKPVVQGGASNPPLVSQSARVEGGATSTQSRNGGGTHLAAIQNPPLALHNSGATTARPTPTDHVNDLSSINPGPPIHESSPKRGGVIIRGKTIDHNNVHETSQFSEVAGGVDLTIVANGLVQLPPVEAERPTTRRSKSRGSKAPTEGGLSPEYQADGPGMGKIPSTEMIISETTETKPVPPKEPHAPREQATKSGGGPNGGGRRGKHLIQATQPTDEAPPPSSSSSSSHQQQQQQPSALVPTPPPKPKPSAMTTLTDPRAIYQGRQGISSKPIQPINRDAPTPRVPSAPNSKPPDVSARALAQKNKQSQQGGSISLAMEPSAANNQSPPSILVS